MLRLFITCLTRLLTYRIIQMPYVETQGDMAGNDIAGRSLHVDLSYRCNQAGLTLCLLLNSKNKIGGSTQSIFT